MVLRVDLYEVRDQLVVEAEVPGVASEAIELTMTDCVLIIRTKAMPPADRSARVYHRRERRSGDLVREIPLPASARFEDARASLDNGLLTLRIPTSEGDAAGPLRIPLD
jgi:HSP20 family protein